MAHFKFRNTDISVGNKVLVISGVGMNEGGILSVLRSVVSTAENVLPPSWKIIVLAHKNSLLNCSRAELVEFPTIKGSWFKRIWFELITSHRLSIDYGATIWFALHDMTPIVSANRQYVYAHSPSCFAKLALRDFYFDPKFVMHSLVYGFVYSLNIKRNTNVFVQQSWIKSEFVRRFGCENVIVAQPANSIELKHERNKSTDKLKTWIYPCYPRHFKNIELLGEALRIVNKRGRSCCTIIVTVLGTENRYAKWLKKRFKDLSSLKFIGLQSTSDLHALYSSVDGLIFPSKLETWGLPITEAKSYNLPILAADLPFARETVGNYHSAIFFNPDDPLLLANTLEELESGVRSLEEYRYSPPVSEDQQIVGWKNLIGFVCNV